MYLLAAASLTIAIVAVSVVALIGFLVLVSDDDGGDGVISPAVQGEYREIRDRLKKEFRHARPGEILRVCGGRSPR